MPSRRESSPSGLPTRVATRLALAPTVGLALSLVVFLAFGPPGADAADPPPRVRISADGRRFSVGAQGAFHPWGFNYLGKHGSTAEETWDTEAGWAAIEADPSIEVNVDVETGRVYAPSAGIDAPFPLDEFTRYRLLEGLDDIGLSPRHVDEIDHGSARTQVRQAQVFSLALDVATQHFAVEADAACEVAHAQDEVVDTLDVEGRDHRGSPGQSSQRRTIRPGFDTDAVHSTSISKCITSSRVPSLVYRATAGSSP